MEEKTDYIFCINTGRSGSDYIKILFNHVLGCRAFREPKPKGNSKPMRQYSNGYFEPMRKIAQEKAEIIKNCKRDCRVYVETNHCFIKGFGWFIPQYLSEDRIGVIILKREKSKIIESTLRIGSSPLMPYGREWITTPDKKNPIVTPPIVLISPLTTYYFAYFLKFVFRCARFFIRKVFLTELQSPQWLINYELKCLEWYVEETYAQAEAFKKQFPRIKYYEVNIEDLNSIEQVQKMIAYFGCRGKESLSDVVGKPSNLKRPRDLKPANRAR